MPKEEKKIGRRAFPQCWQNDFDISTNFDYATYSKDPNKRALNPILANLQAYFVVNNR